jgi:hypothetical protein
VSVRMLVSANSAKMCGARADGMVRIVARTAEVWGVVTTRVVPMAELDEATAHLLGLSHARQCGV